MVNRPAGDAGKTGGGFTLVEMLAVIAIIILLATLSVGFVSGLVTAMRLTQASELTANILSLARRTALTRSHIVEVRFFQCKDPDDASSTVQWRALQAVELLENGQEQILGRVAIIPNRFIMSGTTAGSPLLSTKTTYVGTAPAVLGMVSAYRRFRFMPDGSTDLMLLDPATTKWFVTVYNENDQAKGDPPPRCVILQIEPVTGALAVLKP